MPRAGYRSDSYERSTRRDTASSGKASLSDTGSDAEPRQHPASRRYIRYRPKERPRHSPGERPPYRSNDHQRRIDDKTDARPRYNGRRNDQIPPLSQPFQRQDTRPERIYYKLKKGRRSSSSNNSPFSSDSDRSSDDDEDEQLNRDRDRLNGDFISPKFDIRRDTDLKVSDQRLQQQLGLMSISRISIPGFHRYWDDSNFGGVDFPYTESPQWVAGNEARWIHCQTKRKNLDDFEQLIRKLPDLSVNDSITALEILRTLKKTNRQAHTARERFEMIDRRRSGVDAEVTFVNTQYLTIEESSDYQGIDQHSVYPLSLLEYRYPFEIDGKSIGQLALHTTNQVPKNQSVHVCSMWSLVTSSGLLVTFSSDDLHSLLGRSMRTRKFDLDKPEPSSRKVRITSPDGRTFNYPRSQCGTYFALLQAVVTCCKDRTNDKPENFEVKDKAGRVLTADNWRLYCSSENAIFIDVKVSLVVYIVPEIPAPALVLSRFDNVPHGHRSRLQKRNRARAREREESTPSMSPTSSQEMDELSQSAQRPKVDESIEIEWQVSVPLPASPYSGSSEERDKRASSRSASVGERSLVLFRPSDQIQVQQHQMTRHAANASEAGSLALYRASERAQAKTGLPINRMIKQVDPFLNRGRSRSRENNRIPESEHRRSRQMPRRQESKPRNSRKSTDAQRTEDSNLKMSTPLSGEASADQSEGQLPVPAFLLWPLKKRARKRRNSARHPPDSPSPAAFPPNIYANGDSKMTSHIPEHLFKLLIDVESSILCKGRVLNDQGREIVELYENTELLSSEGVTISELNDWLDPYSEDNADIFTREKEYTWQHLLSRIYKSWSALANDFCPEVTGHPLTEKLATCRNTFVKLIRSLCEPQQSWRMMSPRQQEQRKTTSYYLFDFSTILDAKVNPQRSSDLYFNSCNICKKFKNPFGRSFPSVDAAKAHLRKSHFEGQDVPDEVLACFIIPDNSIVDFYVCQATIRFMVTILDNLTELEKLVLSIRQGVTVDGVFQESIYCLPKSLLKAYGQFARNVFFSIHIAIQATKNHQTNVQESAWPQDLISADDLTAVITYGYEVEISLNGVKSDLLLMNGAGDYSQSTPYDSVGINYAFLVLVRDLCGRIEDENHVNILKAYKGYVARLEYQVEHHPRRRLRNEVIRCSEELSTMAIVFHEQTTFYETEQRMLPYRLQWLHKRDTVEAEREAINSFLDDCKRRERICDDLSHKLARMEQRLIRAVEIEQDDHGKAILVFTIVTTIFLPLSFATSFLGMNTIGIRDTTSGQWLFWAIALPLTIITLVVAVTIGYHGEKIKDQLSFFYKSTLDNLHHRASSYKPISADVDFQSKKEAHPETTAAVDPHNQNEDVIREKKRRLFSLHRRYPNHSENQEP